MTDDQLRENLKKFRIKANFSAPYSVFNDAELEALLAAKPKTIAELVKLKGFPKTGTRVEKYGKDIIDFFKNGGKVAGMDKF